MLKRAIILFALVLCTVGSLFLAAQNQPSVGTSNQAYEGRLIRIIKQAKAEGRTSINLGAPTLFPTGMDTVNEVIRDYSLLRVAVADTVTTSDDDHIQTWFKLKILETFSRQPRIPEDQPGLTDGAGLPLRTDRHIPPHLLPVGVSETMFVVPGGSVTIDGITLVQTPADKGLMLQKNEQYIGAFFLEDGGRFAGLAAASAGLYHINGDELRPQSEQADGLPRDFRELFGNRLSTLRLEVVRRVGVQPNK
jgi:hypothetical protein